MSAQSYAITAAKQLTMPIVATGVVIDPISVTDVEAVLGAVPPDCTLDEPRKRPREARIELAGIYVGSQQANNSDTSFRLIAPGAVRMVGAEAAQDAKLRTIVTP
jgi:hypothetical protein